MENPDTEVIFNYPDSFCVYKSGRIERFTGTEVVPASVDTTSGVASKDITIDSSKGISARLYIPDMKKMKNKKSIPILIHIHGGAFCVYTAFSPTYHSYINSLVSKVDLLVVSVNYRLATEHLLPTAYEDSWEAVKWVFGSKSDAWLTEYGDYEHVFIAGNSAGGNIAHQMVLRAGATLHGNIRFEGMALMHPYFWGKEPIEFETTKAKERKFMEELWSVINMPGVSTDDPTINPIGKDAPSLRQLGCKRALICIASEDWLVERGRTYYYALKECGWEGKAELFESEGEDHCFYLDKSECEDALVLMDKLVSFFSYREGNGSLKCVWDCCVGFVHVWSRQTLPFSWLENFCTASHKN